ncbi:carboxymuconolactone decarboxylase family protein [Stappia sp. GBMRC 2046]|uniref:Carboxymuconolactone decarboxylase family protein n=1 Tax=Stappia sediminis TaxID=2692190 RepID=A0A7X3LRE2_9HYPH|nr:carboxymuconolactone decarboxylase family protein [Stappia sediminis]MXN63701.1 carboxymuconolactone decarboxylase family protein [Stappia sediminis]
MARINQIADENASAPAAELFGAIKSKVGMVPNLYRVVANQPAVLGSFLQFNEGLNGGSFDIKTREAIALAVAGANKCDYCASAHTAISKMVKADEAEIPGHLRGKSSDPRLQAILTLALAIVENRGSVADADLAAAREAGITEAEVVEIVANVVANIFTNYVNNVAQTDIDFPVVKSDAA